MNTTGWYQAHSEQCTGSYYGTTAYTGTSLSGIPTSALPSDYSTNPGAYCIGAISSVVSHVTYDTWTIYYGSTMTSAGATNSAYILPSGGTSIHDSAGGTINYGSSDNLTWSSSFPYATCTANFTTTNTPSNGGAYGSGSTTPSSTTTYTVSCSYNDVNGTTQTSSAPFTVTVIQPIGASCSVSPTSTGEGNNVTWTATPSGGVGPYSYLWGGNGFLAGSTGYRVTGSYSLAGTYSGSVTVTDSYAGSGTVVTPNQSVGQICTGTNTGFTEQDVQDGGNSTSWETEARYDAAGWYAAAPSDFFTNPQNYCVQEEVKQPCASSGYEICNAYITDTIYSGSGTRAQQPSDEAAGYNLDWHAAMTFTSASGNGPHTTTQMCSNSVTIPLPDMYASFTAAEQNITATAGVPFSIEATVGNNSTSPTGEPVFTTFWFNTTKSTSGAQYKEFSSCDGNSVGCPASPFSETEGTNDNASFTYTFTNPGTYYYEVCTDEDQYGNYTVTDGNTSNNCTGWGTITIPPANINATQGNTVSDTENQPITLAGTVNNVGNATAYYIPNIIQVCDGNCATIDSVFSASSITSLAPSTSQVVSASYTPTQATTPLYYRICGNEIPSGSANFTQGTVTESNPNDNCSGWATLNVNAPTPATPTGLSSMCSADANSVTLSWSPTQYATGYDVRMSDNSETKTTGCNYGWDCSSPPDYLNNAYTSTSITYPTTPGATYDWWIDADGSSGASGTIHGTGFMCTAPDLTPNPTTAQTVTAVLGQPVTVTGGAENVGDASTGTGFNNFFVTDLNAQQTAWGDLQPATYSSSLAVGATGPISATFPASDFPTVGSYYYAYCTDRNTDWSISIPESNQGNDCSGWGTINIIPSVPPSSMSYACSLDGNSVTLSWPAGTGATEYYPRVGATNNTFTPPTTCTNFGWQLNGVDGNGNNVCYPHPDGITGTSVTNFPVTPGQTYWAWVSDGNSGGINWNNPATTGNFECTAPDLTADQGPTAAGTSQVPVSLTSTIRNIGTASTGTSFNNLIQVFVANNLDSNGNPTSQTTPEDNINVVAGPLGAGGTQPVSGTANYAYPAGSYIYRYCADIGWVVNGHNWAGTITESNEGNNCGPWANLTISNPMVYCSPSPSSGATPGQTITWTPTYSGFFSTPSFSWSAPNGTPSSGSGSTFSDAYSTPNNYGVTVTATQGGATATNNCSITISQPTVTLTATPDRVTAPSTGQVTLTWSNNGLNASNSCSISGSDGFSSGTVGISGAGLTDTSTINTATKYILTCTTGTSGNPGSNVTASTNVNVAPAFQNF